MDFVSDTNQPFRGFGSWKHRLENIGFCIESQTTINVNLSKKDISAMASRLRGMGHDPGRVTTHESCLPPYDQPTAALGAPAATGAGH